MAAGRCCVKGDVTVAVQGRRDRVVPVAMNREYAAKFKPFYMRVVQGGHHTERIRLELLSRTFDWLARAANAHRH